MMTVGVERGAWLDGDLSGADIATHQKSELAAHLESAIMLLNSATCIIRHVCRYVYQYQHDAIPSLG